MSTYTDKSRKLLKTVTAIEARGYLLEKGYFNESKLFPLIISPKGLDSISLIPIDWAHGKFPKRTSPIAVISNKGDKGSRVYGLMHPYAYIHLVTELTNENLWEDIVRKLTTKTAVDVYTTPQLTDEGHEHSTSSWQHFNEIDYHNFAMGYEVEAIVDIQNFYGSIYTHSIPWSVLGKEVAKGLVNNYGEVSNRLDKILQNANDGQTNGIQIGNDASDILAEVILKDIDIAFSPYLTEHNAVALRFRDDYRLLCKDRVVAKHLQEHLTQILNDKYNLSVNMSKTKITSVVSSGKDYRDYHLSRQTINEMVPIVEENKVQGYDLYKYIKTVAEISQYYNDRSFINSRIAALLKILSENDLKIEKVFPWAEAMVSLLVLINNSYPVNTSYMLAVMNSVAKAYKDENPAACQKLLKRVLKIYSNSSNLLLNIWLYVLCVKIDSDIANEFLNNQNNEIFNMIKNTSTRDARFFPARDPIDSADLSELDKFSLIDLDGITQMEESDLPVVQEFDVDELKAWLNDYYE